MTSLRHSSQPGGSADDVLVDRALDAARAAILDVGWRRTTLTDVARRAGVSRMTLYRRWPDMQTLLADLMTREWTDLADASAPPTPTDGTGSTRELVAGGVAATVAALRGNELFARIVQVDPELLLPYLLDRRGRSQDAILARLEAALTAGQADGSVRPGNARLLARSVVLAAHGFALSAQTMTDPGDHAPGDPGGPAEGDLGTELRALVDRYLAP
jgi:AcrR family transcriptional regulator